MQLSCLYAECYVLALLSLLYHKAWKTGENDNQC